MWKSLHLETNPEETQQLTRNSQKLATFRITTVRAQIYLF